MSAIGEYVWVVAQYDPRSDRGKSVVAHAEHGVGYVVQNKNRMKSDHVVVGFKYPAHITLPSHLIQANPFQVKALEDRHGR